MKATICKYFLYTILGASLSYNAYATSPKKPTPEQKGLATINQESAKAQVGFLASDELEGREAGWKSGRIAGNYIASLLQQMGMKPLFNDYFQPFDAYRVERQKKEDCRFIRIPSHSSGKVYTRNTTCAMYWQK